jgi:hypothetical protein
VRRSRPRGAIAVAALAAAGVWLTSSGSALGAGARQTGGLTFSSQVPSTATGQTVDVQFTNPDNPDQKPYSLARFVVHYPAGTIFDHGAAPQCTASDAELQVEGSAACPPESKVGSGLAVSDTGASGGPFPRYSNTTITQFNGQGDVIGVGENQDIPAIKTVTHSKFDGTTVTTDFPPFPGLPPPDPYTPLKSLNVVSPVYVRDGRTAIRTPPACPAGGYWTIAVDFTYRDGVTQSTTSRSACTRRR